MKRPALALALVVLSTAAVRGQAVHLHHDNPRPEERPAAAPQDRPARFKTGVDLVPLDVCVEERDGRPAAGLKPEDFLILENNIPQQIAFFVPEERVHLAVSLVIDTSQSMAGTRLDHAKAAAAGFIEMLRAEDLVEVVTFNERVTLHYPLGPDHDQAKLTLSPISAAGTTGLFEAALVALRRLGRASKDPTVEYRDVMIVISDGEDTSSRPSFDDVLDDVRRSNTLVYAISLQTDGEGRSLAPPWQMARLATDTGGRAVSVPDLSNLTEVYREIGEELFHLYRVAYVPTTTVRDGSWRTVSVRPTGRDLVIRTRSGYFAPRDHGKSRPNPR